MCKLTDVSTINKRLGNNKCRVERRVKLSCYNIKQRRLNVLDSSKHRNSDAAVTLKLSCEILKK